MQLQILKNHGIFVQIFCFCFFLVVFFFVGLIFWFIYISCFHFQPKHLGVVKFEMFFGCVV